MSILEDAYISSRYLPREFDKELVDSFLNFAEVFKDFAENLENEPD